MARSRKQARLDVAGFTGLFSACDTPRGARKGALILAVTADGQVYVHCQRHGAVQKVTDFVDHLRTLGSIDLAHWHQIDAASYMLHGTFELVKPLPNGVVTIPGTGTEPPPADYEVPGDVRFARSVKEGSSRWTLIPQPRTQADDNVEEIAA